MPSALVMSVACLVGVIWITRTREIHVRRRIGAAVCLVLVANIGYRAYLGLTAPMVAVTFAVFWLVMVSINLAMKRFHAPVR